MPREVCLDCTRKHLSQAHVLLNEFADDPIEFEEHFWYAMGHLAEASDECKGFKLSNLIRAHRRKMIDDPDYWIDFKPLIRLATRYAYLVNGETLPDDFEELYKASSKTVEEYLFECCLDDVKEELRPDKKSKKKKD